MGFNSGFKGLITLSVAQTMYRLMARRFVNNKSEDVEGGGPI